MMSYNGKIETGMLFKVSTDDFKTSGEKNKVARQVILRKGEIIEIRFPYEWHFRTEDDIYFHAEPEMIKENCDYFGTIIEQVKFNNKSNLEDILKLELYNY